jgi:hypothetical protein
VAVNMRRDGDLFAWAKGARAFRPRRPRHAMGHPFVIGRDGDRATVIATCYRDEHLPHRPDLLACVNELPGKELGCRCAPLACHADVLAKLPENDR